KQLSLAKDACGRIVHLRVIDSKYQHNLCSIVPKRTQTPKQSERTMINCAKTLARNETTVMLLVLSREIRVLQHGEIVWRHNEPARAQRKSRARRDEREVRAMTAPAPISAVLAAPNGSTTAPLAGHRYVL